MKAVARKSVLSGRVSVPGSKSHMIRALIIAALADGESVLESPLDSFDTRSAADAVEALGAVVLRNDDRWTVKGIGGLPTVPDDVIDVGNSGTTLYMLMSMAALADGWTFITGDEQIRRRTASSLIDALTPLGVDIFSSRGNGCAPLAVKGRMRGGRTSVEAVTSQYLSSLLLACPLAEGDTYIDVPLLNEAPYVHMTLDWLTRQGIMYEVSDDLSICQVKGGQLYSSFSRRIPGDFSTATFLLCAGVLAGREIVLDGLDMSDPQGDRQVVNILRDMGADIDIGDTDITVRGSRLTGCEIDMNAIPDALPMLAVTACFAEGRTVLANVPQARLKETDRIAVMAAELNALGASVRELPDGLVIDGKGISGGSAHGHGDHRVVMSLTVAGMAADGPVAIDTAEAAGVTYPAFWDTVRELGGDVTLENDSGKIS